jgi:hypothetical protein
MNLREFLAYRSECPFCQHILSIELSGRKNFARYETDRILFITDMKSIVPGQLNYKVAYSLGLDDNSFCIEFFTHKGSPTDMFRTEVPHHLIEKFKEFQANVGVFFSLHRCCTNCFRYTMFSADVNLHLEETKNKNIHLKIDKENFGFTLPNDKCMYLCNIYSKKNANSLLYYWKGNPDSIRWDTPFPKDAIQINLSLVPFISAEKTSERLANLIIFS